MGIPEKEKEQIAPVENRAEKQPVPEKEKEVKVEAELKQVEKEKGKQTLVEVQKKKSVHIEVKTDDLPQGKSKPSDKHLSENKKVNLIRQQKKRLKILSYSSRIN